LNRKQQNIAFFVTDHGYGHATRAAAVMAAVARREALARFDIFTTAPQWLFDDPPVLDCRHHPMRTDVGLVQSNPMAEDLEATVAALSHFLPFSPGTVGEAAAQLRDCGSRLVVCDIAPLGIEAAAAAGIPSVLVENFTWDWIYEGYHRKWPALRHYSQYLREVVARATLRIQVRPFCLPSPGSMQTEPVSRPWRAPRDKIRFALGIPSDAPMVLLTMGGLARMNGCPENLPDRRDVYFVIPGAAPKVTRRANAVLLPPRSGYHHPDLVNASDAVIGKAGYSTVAEVYQAGIPFGYLTRREFRESAPLAQFIQENIPSVEIPVERFNRGAWQTDLETLLAMPRAEEMRANGADQVAAHISDLLGGRKSFGNAFEEPS